MTGMTGTSDSAKPDLKSTKAPPRRTPPDPLLIWSGRMRCSPSTSRRIRTRLEEVHRACERRQCAECGYLRLDPPHLTKSSSMKADSIRYSARDPLRLRL